ncbi:MAG TPA: hypothetical protein VEC37_19995 [Bacillota bacterium]|nr:hypothetical protein [Bacillota bacterium]
MAVLSVPIMLDKERKLKFGYGAMIAIEDLTGDGFLDVIQELQEKPRIKTVRNILWAGLIHEDKTLTPDQVTEILDNCELDNLLGKLNEAIGLSQGGNEGNDTAGEAK